jgi:hypothetical protein
MSPNITKVVAGCYAVRCQLRGARKSLSHESLISLIDLVLTRLNYSNAGLARLYNAQLDRLKSVIRTAAHLIFSARRRHHVTPLLEQRHYLPVWSA